MTVLPPPVDSGSSDDPRFGSSVPAAGWVEDESGRVWVPEVLLQERVGVKQIRVVGLPRTGSHKFFSDRQAEADEFIIRQGGVVHYEGIMSCDHYEGDSWKSKLFLNAVRRWSGGKKAQQLNGLPFLEEVLTPRVVWENHDVEMCWLVEHYPVDEEKSWIRAVKNFRQKPERDQQTKVDSGKDVMGEVQAHRAGVAVAAATASERPVLMLWSVETVPAIVQALTDSGYRVEGVVWRVSEVSA